MRKRDALKLHNGDEVKVRTSNGKWEIGQVYGNPAKFNLFY